MIEKYFKAGIRYKWRPPGAVAGAQDGQLVDNRGASSTLIYDGIDGNLQDATLLQVNVGTIGLRMGMQIQHVWLDYVYGRTSRVPVGPYDVLTGFMSGCWIVYWWDRGVRYVSHVGTIGNPGVDKQVKSTFARAMGQNAKGFNPFKAWSTAEMVGLQGRLKAMARPQILALVTTTGQFYSVLMFDLVQNNEWCCGGAKPCPPVSRDGLMLELRKLKDR